MNRTTLAFWCCLSPGVFIALGACAQSENPPPQVAVRDSIGVAIVENSQNPRSSPPFADIDPIPLTEIGVGFGDPSKEFGEITTAAFLSGERILVADGQACELKLFSSAGDLVWSFGRRGSGPGEFRSLTGIKVSSGDTISVWDGGAGRLTIIDPETKEFRSVALGGGGKRSPTSAMFLPSGTLLASFFEPGKPHPGTVQTGTTLFVDSVSLAVVDLTGDVVSEIGTFLSRETVWEVSVQGATVSRLAFDLPFSRGTFWAASGENIIIGTNDEFEVLIFGFDGDLKKILRAPMGNQVLTLSAIDAYRSYLLQLWGETPDSRMRVERRFNDFSLPRIRPAFSELIFDRVGLLWVGEYQPEPADRRLWYVFRLSGELLGTVTAPAGTVIRDIGDSQILLQAHDELGIPVVRVHRLRRNASD